MSCGIVEDIEDILKSDSTDVSFDDHNRSNNKSFIIPKSIKKYSKINDKNDKENDITNTNVPGVASIFVKTWGCTHNNSDSEYMAGQLAAYGYKLTGI